MPQQTKIFRVFVSSTFTDMKEERRVLQKDVFPRLEKFCEENNAKFQAVDLRWGVNEETSLNQKTLELCLTEIDRCKKISPKPNFIILLGDKYGWQPIPSKIPTDEMQKIVAKLSEVDLGFLTSWYRLDENAIPAEYVLQPRGEEYQDRKTWEPVESKIRTILRNAVSSLGFSPEKIVKYFASATHQEIIRGALSSSESDPNPEEHVFAFFRTINGLPKDDSAEGFIDLTTDGKQDEYSDGRLIELRGGLQARLGNHCVPLHAVWEAGKSKLIKGNQFANDAYDFLHATIDTQLKEVISSDEIEQEVKLHRDFNERLTKHFIGRKETLSKIHLYLADPADHKVLSLLGDSGTGKSSVMAQAIKLNSNEGNIPIFRFIGITSKSSTIESLLNSVCHQISEAYGVKLETLAGEGKEKSLHEMQGLSEVFKKCLGLASPQKPLILFLDALDQLSESGKIRSLYWLPRELPEHVKIIVSCLTEFEKDLSFTHIEQLSVLTEEEAKEILNSWLSTARRTLTEAQFKLVIDNFKKTNGLAIYLKLAFEVAKEWQSYDDNVVLKEDVAGIINDYFDWLEDEHTKELVTNVICYMLCGRYEGLAENEILEILVFDKEYWEKVFLPKSFYSEELEKVTKIPIIVWSRLFLDLEPFLTEKDADGVPIITFFHRQFIKVLKERYKLFESPEGDVQPSTRDEQRE